ncbi:hypothetical protein, partial [Arthrobacter sp. HS15c]|uniref:hypothetical protein n=1 Tax=Arthrobacter sp. HS15c TaxID=3230279 RepID=UPI003466E427
RIKLSVEVKQKQTQHAPPGKRETHTAKFETSCKNQTTPRGGITWSIQPIQYNKLVSTNLAHY